MAHDKDEFCPTPSFPGYSVSRDGVVVSHRTIRSNGRGRPIESRIDPTKSRVLRSGRPKPYYVFSLRVGGKNRPTPLHVLLLDAFVGPRPPGAVTRHLDGNPLNNSLENIVYGTQAENMADMLGHGTRSMGESHGRARLTEDDVRSMRRRFCEGATSKELAVAFNVSLATAHHAIVGRTWSHLPNSVPAGIRGQRKAASILRSMEAAKRLIVRGHGFAFVAKQCGYQHAAHFGHRFKAVTGVTPREWRQLNRDSAVAA